MGNPMSPHKSLGQYEQLKTGPDDIYCWMILKLNLDEVITKYDDNMTRIVKNCKQKNPLMHTLKETQLFVEILSWGNPMSLNSSWADRNYLRWELMNLITGQYQYTDWPIKVPCNMRMNLKWGELMTRTGLMCK